MTFLASLYSKGHLVRLLLVVCIVFLLLPVVGRSSILVVRAAAVAARAQQADDPLPPNVGVTNNTVTADTDIDGAFGGAQVAPGNGGNPASGGDSAPGKPCYGCYTVVVVV